MVRTLRIVPCAALLFVAACASAPRESPRSGGTSSSLLALTEWSPPPGQTCREVPRRSPLPALEAMFDSTALHATVAQLPAGGSAVVSVWTDTIGKPALLRVIDTTLPETSANALQEAFGSTLRAGAPVLEHMRVRVDVGTSPRFTRGSNEECLPAMRNAEEVQARLRQLAQEAPRAGTTEVRVRVETDGSLSQVQVAKSSGSIELDRIAVEAARVARFHPGRLDRTPIASWVQFPVNIEVQQASPPPPEER